MRIGQKVYRFVCIWLDALDDIFSQALFHSFGFFVNRKLFFWFVPRMRAKEQPCFHYSERHTHNCMPSSLPSGVFSSRNFCCCRRLEEKQKKTTIISFVSVCIFIFGASWICVFVYIYVLFILKSFILLALSPSLSLSRFIRSHTLVGCFSRPFPGTSYVYIFHNQNELKATEQKKCTKPSRSYLTKVDWQGWRGQRVCLCTVHRVCEWCGEKGGGRARAPKRKRIWS